MTPYDPPGEDKAFSRAMLAQEREERRIESAANDMVLDARQHGASDHLALRYLALRYLANEYEDSESRTRAFEMILDDIGARRAAA